MTTEQLRTQTTYTMFPGVARPGMIHGINYQADSLVVDETNGIAFGRAVQQSDSAANAGSLGVARTMGARLNGALNNSATDITIDELSDDLREQAYVIVDDEIMLVTGVTNTTLTVVRAVRRTAAASHNDDTVVYLADAHNFRGISIMDKSLPVEDNDTYVNGKLAAVMHSGEIWVQTDGAVTVGADVTAHLTTGELGSAAPDGDHVAIAGARWMTAAANNGVARVRLAAA